MHNIHGVASKSLVNVYNLYRRVNASGRFWDHSGVVASLEYRLSTQEYEVWVYYV
jgi:hypothetical protein